MLLKPQWHKITKLSIVWNMALSPSLNACTQMHGIRSVTQDGQSAWYYSRLISETSRQKFTPIFPLSASYTSLPRMEYFMTVSWEGNNGAVTVDTRYTTMRAHRHDMLCYSHRYCSWTAIDITLNEPEGRESWTVSETHHSFLHVEKTSLHIVDKHKDTSQCLDSLQRSWNSMF
jgi:hypothetical protein